MPFKILITGAHGFIGQALATRFQSAGHVVASFEGDITDEKNVTAQVGRQSWDFVYHLAAISSPGVCEKFPGRAYTVNLIGTALLVESLIKAKSNATFVFPSTAHVYLQDVGELRPLNENSQLSPVGVYARTKFLGEELLRAAGLSDNFRSVIFRLFNHSHVSQAKTFALPRFYDQLSLVKAGKIDSIRVGNIDIQRDFGTLKDLIKALSLVVDESSAFHGSTTQTLNIASGQPRSLRNIILKMASALEIQTEINIDPALVRPNDPPFVVGDISKITAITSWRPQKLTDDEFVREFISTL